MNSTLTEVEIYLGLTRTEVTAIGVVLLSAVQSFLRPTLDEFDQLPIENKLAITQVAALMNGLVDDDDYTQYEIGEVVALGTTWGVDIPRSLTEFGKTCEKYVGIKDGTREYHTLRKFKHARWLIKAAEKVGVDLACIYVFSEAIRFVHGDMMKLGVAGSEAIAIAWFEVAEEPQDSRDGPGPEAVPQRQGRTDAGLPLS